ncbi:hypothetical protein JKP88DRAFT_198591 [Tribonema minus]|uniref:Golgi apparatus membrane protein TVP23 homolog n=1 Tax=Tribonema minus TaxID=303371 RepID=A0A835Z0U0_9STRA|nr:hypothetical protein JKP88DRAFT_198591 [Tribonema minus]|eukprot:TRINITY_DN1045_c0_g1_i2.p1 TRINITY_DN1045_c0_g1~~TRINITY_DN1045_c0_g1_i2.p1  ORF type:complete len:246 (-),score=60.51 TRINITY_DN1045_c0_g1_i2:437-1174(-)
MPGEGELEFINAVDQKAVGGGGGGAHSQSPTYPIGGAAAAPAGSGGTVGLIKQAHHPVAALFHFLFKGLAIFVYIFGGLISSNFVLICVATILLLAFDFWTVKNITGRLMVGLRWWSNVKEDGTTSWVFESLENMSEIQPADSKLFWIGLYAAPAVWVALFIIGLLKFNLQWLIIVVVAILLSTANIVGYTKCSNDAKNKVRNFMQDGAMAAMGNAGFRNMMFSVLTGGGGGSAAPPPPQGAAMV